jgi:hypothetical protein
MNRRESLKAIGVSTIAAGLILIPVKQKKKKQPRQL